VVGETDPELMEKRFLLRRGLGHATQADLTTVGGGQNDVGAVQCG